MPTDTTVEEQAKPSYSISKINDDYFLCENMLDWEGTAVRRPVYRMSLEFDPESVVRAAAQAAREPLESFLNQAADYSSAEGYYIRINRTDEPALPFTMTPMHPGTARHHELREMRAQAFDEAAKALRFKATGVVNDAVEEMVSTILALKEKGS